MRTTIGIALCLIVTTAAACGENKQGGKTSRKGRHRLIPVNDGGTLVAPDANLPGGIDDPLMSPMKRKKPHWLIGGTSRFRTCYNYALPEVRAYRLALAEEAIANYDLDGLDWDFCRIKTLFATKPGPETEQYAPLLTELMRKLRAAVERKSGQVGRKISLSVRVPVSFQFALSYGIDVKT